MWEQLYLELETIRKKADVSFILQKLRPFAAMAENAFFVL
ncbi:hypothetical protein J623_2919 [Acinetobacter sp. 1245249]|nr:hypothetical protein J623_2919 [Acinetobacter sp. 1245249]